MGNGLLSQEEIDALLKSTLEPESNEETMKVALTAGEQDAIRKIAENFAGNAATTLAQISGKKVNITVLNLEVSGLQQIGEVNPGPMIIADIGNHSHSEGSNSLILAPNDGAVISDLVTGGEGTTPREDISEKDLQAISEVLKQMMNSAVDYYPSRIVLDNLSNVLNSDLLTETYVFISYRIVIEDLLDSVIEQIMVVATAKELADKLWGGAEKTDAVDLASAVTSQIPLPLTMPGNPAFAPSHYTSGPKAQIQPAHFSPLYAGQPMPQADNLELILDVSLQVSIELGKTRKTIKEILDMGPGSIIELDRLAGEPVDMIINGKLVAKCEVVVINETFGVRVIDIVQPAERMKTLN
ncbi:MAG TPA: flagellar motor switch phosphatase FliY [Desulfitobacteriaceae bacterium]|nr:flagellar motor switch phosphatase FliY [Desulfitobacteriaceae bacterium]